MENIKDRELFSFGVVCYYIGEFYYRSKGDIYQKLDCLQKTTQQLAEKVSSQHDTDKNQFQPVLWANEFMENTTVPFLKSHLEKEKIVNIMCGFVVVENELQALISMAKSWSRGKLIDSTIYSEPKNDETYPLYSIFNGINNGTGTAAFSLHQLSNDEQHCFPDAGKNKKTVNREMYLTLWNKFLDEFKMLPASSFTVFIDSLQYLMKKYTWCMPDSFHIQTEISLFDQMKTTAAFANCLYTYKESAPEAFEWDESSKKLKLTDMHAPVLLLGGDISGIQSFIYNIASRKAAVSLKGRSFYLQLLIDSILMRILSHSDIQATQNHVVYSSGGKFYAILPNTRKIIAAITALQKEFEQTLWQDHHGKLIFNMDYVPFSFNTEDGCYSFNNTNQQSIGYLWKQLADKLTECKNNKFKSLLQHEYEQLFTPQSIYSSNKNKMRVCAVTGIESEKCAKIDSKEASAYVLPQVKKQVELGLQLKDADYLVMELSDKKNEKLIDASQTYMEILGVHTYLFDEKDTSIDALLKNLSENVSIVKTINAMTFLTNKTSEKNSVFGFQFYGGNRQAQNKNHHLKTFEELASDTYLGVLRMDVDGLGSIFIKGLPERARNFSAYSTLSFMLDYYFSGYLNTIREKYKDYVNILYSGGDDVFAVGKWTDLISFAEDVRQKFAEFVGREDISISAGITLIGEKYPISKAAELAHEAEDNAKKFRNGEKNAINLFGENVSWNTEFTYVKNKKSTFINLCETYNMPRSILHKLMQFCEVMRSGDMRYLWHTAYFLKRFSEGKNEAIQLFCKNELMNEISDKRKLELIAVAARWAELETKKTNNN